MDWIYVLMFFLGILVGGIATRLIFMKKRTAGDLVVVDDVKDDRPYIFLNINREDLEALHDTEIIKLNVDRKKPHKLHAL